VQVVEPHFSRAPAWHRGHHVFPDIYGEQHGGLEKTCWQNEAKVENRGISAAGWEFTGQRGAALSMGREMPGLRCDPRERNRQTGN
jgi:hypothetical protein